MSKTAHREMSCFKIQKLIKKIKKSVSMCRAQTPLRAIIPKRKCVFVRNTLKIPISYSRAVSPCYTSGLKKCMTRDGQKSGQNDKYHNCNTRR